MKKPVVIDFETDAIAQRPDYPPEPAGVAIKWPGKKAVYHAWNHPAENNTCKHGATSALMEAWRSDHPLLFHNAKFDLAVAYEKLGMPVLPWERVHDTMFLLFLDDPYSKSLALKPSAERYLKLPPLEQDAVKNWLLEHRVITRAQRDWGAHISKAPGGLVGQYAVGDVDRTAKLFDLLYDKVRKDGMLHPYDVERQLMPILMRNEYEGLHVDVEGLARDIAIYTKAQATVDAWLKKRLKVREINLDSNEELADALESSGVVTEFAMTAKGNRSVAKDTLTLDRFNDPKVWYALAYRSRLGTAMNTFMLPWLRMAEASGGKIHTSWNQVRQPGAGAKTGRMSCSPNFMNIPKNFEGKDDGYKHPQFIPNLPELPLLRKYILPDGKGHLFGHRDFSQQELRILAHYENDGLRQAYLEDPKLDVHTFVQTELARIGINYGRGEVKATNFGMLYGMGAPGLSRRLGISHKEAQSLIAAQRRAMPGLAQLIRDIKEHVNSGAPIVTWGGRRYFVEPPEIRDGDMRSNDYKMLNYLIQGSAADCTKQALINYDSVDHEARFLVTVHDEINISAPKKAMRKEMGILRDAMAAVEFDVPMLSDGKTGVNWGSLEKFKD